MRRKMYRCLVLSICVVCLTLLYVSISLVISSEYYCFSVFNNKSTSNAPLIRVVSDCLFCICSKRLLK